MWCLNAFQRLPSILLKSTFINFIHNSGHILGPNQTTLFALLSSEPNFDPSVANCDFEEGFCEYHQERAGGSVWNRVSVKPNVYRVGDHTTGTGER